MLYTALHVGPAAARTPSTAVASPLLLLHGRVPEPRTGVAILRTSPTTGAFPTHSTCGEHVNTQMLYTELHVGPAAARTPSITVASPRAATPRPPRPRSRQMLLHYTSRAASPRPPRSRFYDIRTSPRSRFYDIRTSELHIFSIAPSTLRPWLAKKSFFFPCASLASTRPPRMNFPQHRYHSQRKIFLRLAS